MNAPLRIVALCTCLCACSPADWAAVHAAGSVAGAAVDTFALVRAEQIRNKGQEAETAAASGDTMGALRALSEAQALTTAKTFEELAEVRRELAAARSRCPACELSPTCVLDAPGQPPAPAGASCGAGRTCDGAGMCCPGGL